MGKDYYRQCDLMGTGHIKVLGEPSLRRHSFEVLDITHESIKIRSKGNFAVSSLVDIYLAFSGYIRGIELDIKGIVTDKSERKRDYIYTIKFTDLSEEEIVEIDEIIQISCTMGPKQVNSCDHGDCKIK